MLKEERHNTILDGIRQQGKVLTLDLSQVLGVSEDTIRRDLKELADLGLVRKVHGGAVPASLNPFRYEEREVYAHEEKITIAEKASLLFRDGQVVLMDGGTTNLELARRFPDTLRITLITNSLPVAQVLADHPAVETMLLGGKLLKSARVTVGPPVIESLAGIRADVCVLGTRSIHPQLGISEIDWDETQVKRAMLQAAHEVMALVITEKVGGVNPYLIGDPRKLTTLVTRDGKRNPLFRPFADFGIEIL
ncbi:MAG: DeoR/GlpR family DNA-binding transcription regulator [Bacteroidia bacterium]|nr:DeoR/GlpR family DNA-binding transcription regulator [Bacteroidia bacterium]